MPERKNVQHYIYVASGEIQAQQVRSFLQAHGIKTIERGDTFRNLFDIEGGETGAVEIFVAPEDEARAKALLRSAEAGAFRLSDDESDQSKGPSRSDR